MARTITKIEILYQKKEKRYNITTYHKEGSWEGSTSGIYVYEVGGFLVQMAWGKPTPVAVYLNKGEMMDSIRSTYGIAPILK